MKKDSLTLGEWIQKKGRGEITRLSHSSGLAYTTIWHAARTGRKMRYDNAQLIHNETLGAVSIKSLCEGFEVEG